MNFQDMEELQISSDTCWPDGRTHPGQWILCQPPQPDPCWAHFSYHSAPVSSLTLPRPMFMAQTFLPVSPTLMVTCLLV